MKMIPCILLGLICLIVLIQGLVRLNAPIKVMHTGVSEDRMILDLIRKHDLKYVITAPWANCQKFHRPLSAAVMWIINRFFGNNPANFRLAALLLHIATMIVISIVAVRLSGWSWSAPLVAGLWGLAWWTHGPRWWICNFSDPLAAVFVALAILTYINRQYLLTVLFGLIAVSARELAILPLMVLIPFHRYWWLSVSGMLALIGFGIFATMHWHLPQQIIDSSKTLLQTGIGSRRFLVLLILSTGIIPILIYKLNWQAVLPTLIIAALLIAVPWGERYLYLPTLIMWPLVYANVESTPERKLLAIIHAVIILLMIFAWPELAHYKNQDKPLILS